MKRHFTEEMANMHMNGCSTSLAIKKYKFLSTPIRLTKKVVTTSNASEDVENLDHSYIADGNIKWYRRFGNSLAVPLKTVQYYKHSNCISWHVFHRNKNLCSHSMNVHECLEQLFFFFYNSTKLATTQMSLIGNFNNGGAFMS